MWDINSSQTQAEECNAEALNPLRSSGSRIPEKVERLWQFYSWVSSSKEKILQYGKNQAVGESRRRAVNTQTSLLMKQNVPHGFAFKRKKIRAMCSITGRLYKHHQCGRLTGFVHPAEIYEKQAIQTWPLDRRSGESAHINGHAPAKVKC